MANVDLSVVMPFYNEGKQTKIVSMDVLKNLKRSSLNFELILVDNGSRDVTGKIIDKLTKKYKQVVPVHIEKNIGYGFGVRTGLNKAKGNVLGWIDGDGQFGPENILKEYKKLKSGKYGLCKGRRIVRYDGLKRKISSLFYNTLFNILFLNTLKDINGKPKLITRECYDSFDIISNDWFIDAEIIIKAIRNNYKICEVPLKFKARKEGKSNVRLRTVWEFTRNLFKFRFANMI